MANSCWLSRARGWRGRREFTPRRSVSLITTYWLPSMSREACGEGTVKVSKVKGHASQAMVDNGDVRHEDHIGNNGADTAADLGRLRQQDSVITARR